MPAPAKLNLERILTESIRLLRDEGLEEVTLRKLAGRLGVEAPSLYRHIGGKRQLQTLMVLRLFRMQLDQVGAHDSWQEWLTVFGHVLWNTQGSIRDCARLVLTAGFEREDLEVMAGWVAEALAPYGINAQTALEIQLAIQALILGLVGLAEGPSKGSMRAAIPFDAVLDHSLGAMIAGWETRLSRLERPEANAPGRL